ncbi:hypothetical protein IVB14_10665 [Bradyrhizobium sp. 180]|uniref:hypothetical protein n=1 Tax=unclassified Bradyrhizobium TaxID=2631580 RepID=UPI001FF74217|nr:MULTISPECIES: hypothetical protein [unclassified Bradyrhizobium]MCK1424433.1 hypothetical protein [Bradyrhizobium sp. CW12]MCK1490863.1 hypothetical protein [Bradyrhizobium sp. 180]MCK1528505.1 hypothetical protein [Bradyrhizobium sp. 182]MCK1596914.1 hypothetical protein [Bradyrhizobium sp. 164]MCK1644954.1 hypothetical protein [Bradyrhizobium sp. 154]
MIDQRRNAPRRYFVDAQGRRVLIGLSLQETAEFEALDLSPNNKVQFASEICVSEAAAAATEFRWLELYSRHERAWRAWIEQSQAERAQDLGFVNYV